MKINYKNTALGLLDNLTVSSFRIAVESKDTTQEEVTALGLSIVDIWPKVSHMFKQRVRYITNPFYSAYIKAMPKIADVLDKEDIDESGTFVMKSSESETNTIFYQIRTEGKGEDFKLNGAIFFFNSNIKKDKPSLVVYVQRNSKGIKQWLSDVSRKNELSNISVFADIFSMLLFLKYCELETKTIKPEKREWHIGTKYINETKHRIEVLDSTWFTTIVRSEGFTVGGNTGGFFRLQPCGKDLAERKLIWVMPFEKEGYTRKARILNNQNQ